MREAHGTLNDFTLPWQGAPWTIVDLARRARASGLDGRDARVQRLGRGRDIFGEGDSLVGLSILRTGWACRYRLLPDGRRHIIGFIIPGDIIISYSLTAEHFVATLTEASVLWISTPGLVALDPEGARAGALLNIVIEEYERICEAAVGLGRLTAIERMAWLVLELYQRTTRAGLARGMSFPFPATQEDFADALGVSSAHVNRTVRRLRQERLATITGRWVTIHDLERLGELAGCEGLTAAA